MKKIPMMLTLCFLLLSMFNGRLSMVAAATPIGVVNVLDTIPTANIPSAYAEGDIMMKDGKWVVYTSGEWKPVENDMMLENGVLIKKNGEIVDKNGKTVVLKNGERVSKTGLLINKADAAANGAWNATRGGVTHAAEATEGKVKKGYRATKTAVVKAKDVTKDKVGQVSKKVKRKAQKVGDAAKELKEDWKE